MNVLVALRAWHDFYVGLGFTSAALLGFVFLGLLQRGNHVRGESHARESETLGFLFAMLLISLLVLIPEQSQRPLGVVLLAAGVLGLAATARQIWRETRWRLKSASAAFLAWRVALPLAVLACETCGSLIFLAGSRYAVASSLYLLCASFLAMLVLAARNTWELVAHSGQERLKLHRGNRG